MSSPQPAVYVAGIGMTPSGKFLDRSIKQLTADAVNAALADAGLRALPTSRAAFFSNATQGAAGRPDHGARPDRAALAWASKRIPVYNLENACASASSAFNLAVQLRALRRGRHRAGRRRREDVLHRQGQDVRRLRRRLGRADCRGQRGATCWRWARASFRPRAARRQAPYSLFMDIYAALRRASTCASSAPRSDSSRPSRRRTTATRCTTRWRSTATPTPSTRCWPRRRSPTR